MTYSPNPPAIDAQTLTVLGYDGSTAEWDDFVRQAVDSTFCHLAEWRGIMAEVLGHDCLYMIAVDSDGRWHGVLPLVRVKNVLLGQYLVSMPFLNYGGPIGTRGAQVALAEAAVREARRSHADLLELRTRHALPADLTVSHRKITVLLPLPSSSETLWREVFPSNLRTRIRRPKKEGMEVRFGADQVEAFYEVFSVNMRDLGTPVLTRRLFERVARVFSDIATFGVVYWRERPLAAGCGFTWRDEFELTWVSALRRYKRMAPNNLLYWSFIERLIAQGVRVFNFGRCTPGSGTHRFKRQWGGVDTPLPWLQWSPRCVHATPTPDRPLLHLATSAWKRVPLVIANKVGPLLSRGLP